MRSIGRCRFPHGNTRLTMSLIRIAMNRIGRLIEPRLDRKDVPMKFMNLLRLVLLGVAMAAATLSSVEPASALGGCGANRHRNAWGRCVWGGQNEDWCLRKTGHRATYVGRGVWRCFR